jgi:HK97 family phage major capsid protein
VRAADGGGDGEDGQPCKTCGGTGRLRHPRTGKPSVKCPSCGGSGIAPDDDDQDEDAPGAALDHFPWGRSWSAFLGVVRDNGPAGQGARAAIRAAMGERVPSEGGFLVPENLRAQILTYMTGGIVRPRCTLVPMDSLRVPIPLLDNPDQASGAQALGGLTFAMTEESTAIPASVPNFGRIALEARKAAAYLENVPNELLADATAFTEVFLPVTIARGLDWFIDDMAIWTGSGVGEPQALVNAPGQVTVTRNTSDTVLHADVVAMLKALHPASKTTASWLASEDVFDQLLELYELAGSSPTNTTIAPPNVLKFKGGSWTLFGLEVLVNDHQPAVGTPGDLALCDLRLYLWGERAEMLVETSSKGAGFAADASNIRVKQRFDGRFWLQSPVTLANGKVTSPLVVLGAAS